MGKVGNFLSVAKSLFNMKTGFHQLQRDRKDRIAEYFENISGCLAEVSRILRSGQYPSGKCAELDAYADQLPSTIGDIIGDAKAKKLSEDLHAAHRVEMLLSELSQMSSREADALLSKLDEASGLFKALANSIRAE